MKQLIDFIPLVIFFVFFKTYDIYIGVQALMIASTIALAVTWFIYRKIDKIALFVYLMVMIFGALTLIFHKDEFIKWKVTIIYTIFALALLISQYVYKKPLIKTLLGREIRLTDIAWNNINLIWAVFFVICGVINIYISYQLSQNAWVNYKTFILPGTTLILSLFSGVYIYKKGELIDKNTEENKKNYNE